MTKPIRRFSPTQGDHVVVVEVGDPPPYELVAQLLTLITFIGLPPDSQEFKRKQLAICTTLLMGLARSATGAANYMAIKPIHFSLPEKEAQAVWRRVSTSLLKRLAAGHVALIRMGLDRARPDGARTTSTTSLLFEALGTSDLPDESNAMQRMWRDVLPVIALCAAFQAVMQEVNSRYEDPYAVADLIVDEEACDRVLELTLQYQELIAGLPHLHPSKAPRMILSGRAAH